MRVHPPERFHWRRAGKLVNKIQQSIDGLESRLVAARSKMEKQAGAIAFGWRVQANKELEEQGTGRQL